MNIDVDQKQITYKEKTQIAQQVKEELVEHLYQGCLPGTITGLVVSFALFLDYYHYSPTHLLIVWLVFFNFAMVALSALFFTYRKFKSYFTLNYWEWAYSAMMSLCAVAWVPAIFLLPADYARQYLALLAYFMATTGYSTGSIGQFRLCVVTLNIMLIPLMIWCFLRGGIFYNIIGTYSLIYMMFMIGINLRSTRWFIESLKLKLENTLVTYQANHDILTDLPNQRLIPQYIDSAIHYAQKTQTLFAVVYFSLNRMEIISDTLGHQAGNTILKTVADRLRNLAAREEKKESGVNYVLTISRKDAFTILVVAQQQNVIDEKIKELFSVLDDSFYLEKKEITITASMGVSVYPKDGSDPQSLLKNADAAMLRAKQIGGNRIEFYRTEINERIPKQLELENELYSVLKNKQLQVYYQPLIDLKTRKIAGMEALLRWKHPVHGFISPVQFIPLAEETALIVPIGAWVLEEACAQTKIWHQMGFTTLKVAVNLSQKQLSQENITTVIKDVLTKTQLEPRFLELELTETAILDETVIPTIKAFKEMGLGLAVDDFGTGYSGLSYLKRFSIDKLKIDQSFIRDIPSNIDSITIVSAIIAMAKELKVNSLAEGVETEEQVQFLQQKGCNFIQGYYFSKPVEPDQFTQLLLNERNPSEDTVQYEV